MNLLTVSVSPHIRARETTRNVMLNVIIALMPALVASCIIFGLRSLLVTAVSAAACVGFEYLWCRLMHKKVTVGDLSAVVTGILIAFNVPATMPIWKLIVGDMIAIIVVKMLFGGIGCNFVNPALVARVCLVFSFTSDMTHYNTQVANVDVLTSATPLSAIDKLEASDFLTLFMGQHGGVIGETCAFAIIVGAVYLMLRGTIKPIIPLCFIGSTFVFTLLFGGDNAFLSLFSGGLLMGACFMATDYVTSPITDTGRAIFGIGCGLITAAIRVFSNATEGITFAILIMNLLVPYINQLARTKPFGGVAAK